MSNMRVVYDNAADRATITASTTAGGLVPSNLQTTPKSEVWRSTSPIATLTLTWPTQELISAICVPFSSLTSAATFRVRAYTYTTDTEPVLDTGVQMACAGNTFDEVGWGSTPLGVNGYAYGSSSYGTIWFEVGAYQKIVLDIDDNSNPLGYVEAGRIVAGTHWSPVINVEYGVQATVVDTSKQERSDAGDLRTDRGTQHKVVSFDLSLMPSVDRNSLWNILRGSGSHTPVFMSLTPSSDDSIEEQIFQVYGKISRQAAIKYQFANQFSTSLEIEEV